MNRLALFVGFALLSAACGGSSSGSATNSTATTAVAQIDTTEPTTTQPVATTQPIGSIDADPATQSVVIERFATLGGWDGSNWVTWGAPEDFVGPAAAGDEFRILGLDGLSDPASTLGVGVVCDPLESLGIITDPDVPSEWAGENPIAVKAAWDTQPYGPPVIEEPTPFYFDAVREFFSARGVEVGNVDIDQMYRLDLENDGVTEVVLSARTAGLDHSFQQLDYPLISVVLLRRVINEQARTFVLTHDLFTAADGASLGDQAPYFSLYRITTFADLNGDGKLEIVISDRGYESGGTTVWEYVSDTKGPVRVLDGGCGA